MLPASDAPDCPPTPGVGLPGTERSAAEATVGPPDAGVVGPPGGAGGVGLAGPAGGVGTAGAAAAGRKSAPYPGNGPDGAIGPALIGPDGTEVGPAVTGAVAGVAGVAPAAGEAGPTS